MSRHQGPAFAPDDPVGRYWLAHGEGFAVLGAGGRSAGTVEEVVLDGDGSVERLVVRPRLGRARSVDPRTLAKVVPAARSFVLAAEPARPEPTRSRSRDALAALQRAALAVLGAGRAAAAAAAPHVRSARRSGAAAAARLAAAIRREAPVLAAAAAARAVAAVAAAARLLRDLDRRARPAARRGALAARRVAAAAAAGAVTFALLTRATVSRLTREARRFLAETFPERRAPELAEPHEPARPDEPDVDVDEPLTRERPERHARAADRRTRPARRGTPRRPA